MSAGELQDFVKAEIAPYKYPRAIEFVTELPKTATGKLQRFRLAAAAVGRPSRRLVRRPSGTASRCLTTPRAT